MAAKNVSRAIINAVMALLSVLMTIPLIWIILMSLKSTREIIGTSVFSLPAAFRFDNYAEAWIKGMIGDYFLNSIVVTGASTFFVVALGTLFAYALARMRWRLSNLVFGIILLGLMVPIHATLIPVFVTLKHLGLLNSLLCLILPYIASGLPLAIFIFRNFMISIPKEMEEAAFLDGCSVPQSFSLVIVPVIRPAIITVVILTFMHYWNEFVFASTVVQRKALGTLPIGLQYFQSEFTVDWGAMSAGVVVSVVPVLVVYMIFNDVIEKSIVSGALK
jgi:raffinose/stachyose/melibiose transport system permease protein